MFIVYFNIVMSNETPVIPAYVNAVEPGLNTGDILTWNSTLHKWVATQQEHIDPLVELPLSSDVNNILTTGLDGKIFLAASTVFDLILPFTYQPTLATDTAYGLVQLADATAITSGTSGRVVDAAQLKTVNDKILDATSSVKGIVQLADASAVTAGTSGRVVDAAQLKTVSNTVLPHISVYRPYGTGGVAGRWDIDNYAITNTQLITVVNLNPTWTVTTTSYANDGVTITQAGIFEISISNGGTNLCPTSVLCEHEIYINGVLSSCSNSVKQCGGGTLVYYYSLSIGDLVNWKSRLGTARDFYTNEALQTQYVIKKIG
jgi:hypothetical protein